MAGQTVNYVTCPHQDILLLVNVRHPGTGLCQPGQIETPHLQYKIRNKTDGLWLSSQKIKNQEFSVTYRMIDTYTFLQTVYLFSPRISIPFTRVLSLISKIVANACWLKCENITIFCILTSKYNKLGGWCQMAIFQTGILVQQLYLQFDVNDPLFLLQDINIEYYSYSQIFWATSSNLNC